MTRTAFLIALAVSTAVAAQQPPALPLPGAAPELPLPSAAEPRKDEPKAEAASAKRKKKKAADAPADLPLPGAAAAAPALSLPDAPAAAASKDKPAAPAPLALPGLDTAPSAKPALTLPPPAPAKEAQKAPPPLPLTLPGQEPAKEAKKDAPAAKPAAVPAVAPAAPPAAAPASSVKTLTAEKADAPKAGSSGATTGGASSSGPMASAMVNTSDLNLRGVGTNRSLWNVRGYLGAERSSEQNLTDTASLSRLGVEGSRWFQTNFVARVEFDWRSSRQQYIPLKVSQGSHSVAVDENRYDLVGDIGYDVGPRLVPSGRLELTPLLGVAYMGIRNDAFPSDMVGVNVGGRSRFYLSPSVIPHVQVTYTYNFSVPTENSQNSALKSPLGDVQMRAGLALPLAGNYALELDYQGDVLSFQNTYRVAHGAALGFGTSF